MIRPLLPPDEGSAPGSAAGGGTPAPGPGGERVASAGGDEAAAARAIVADSEAADGAAAFGRGAAAPTDVVPGDPVEAAGDDGTALAPAGAIRVVPHCTQNLAPGWVS